jgi:hypothetical protein
MTEQSSLTSQTPSAFYDPESWSWRTSQGSLLSAVPPSLDRLPAWGTASDGVLFELPTPPSLLRTGGRGGFASPGLPTPVVNDMGAGKTVEEWDTWTDEMKAKHGNGNGHGPSLSIEVQRLLPTPRAQNGEPRNMKPWLRPLDQPQNLENALARLPGAVTNQRSDDGNEPSAGQHPHPPTTGNSPADSLNG